MKIKQLIELLKNLDLESDIAIEDTKSSLFKGIKYHKIEHVKIVNAYETYRKYNHFIDHPEKMHYIVVLGG